ncbi:MAG: TonB family protein [Candidatus Omnitrophica bacterium]|nr:TonB family protein [Candidatus Omnitrophota bacterium]MBU1932826.1 TonB family protein [Candidatus Omnitrophota bacterium]
MFIKRIILLYLIVIIIITAFSQTISFAYPHPSDIITNYILEISRDIYADILTPSESVLRDSRGEIRIKLLLSPWGEVKDAYVSESSGSQELDNLCLNAVWKYDRFQPFPEALGEEDLWIEVPVIFDLKAQVKTPEQMSDKKAKIYRTTENKIEGEKLDLYNINDAVDIALENQMAAKIASEEVELARLKLREAHRALFPASSLNYMETIGQTTGSTQDFTDKEYKLKFEYPLYYAGRLKYAVEQAISNVNASRHNYDKALQEIRIEVETGFYAYLASKLNLETQKTLLDQTQKIFDIAKKRFDMGLTTRSEFLQVESQIKQINYQMTSSNNDMEMAKLTLAQAMGIENPDKLESVIDTDINLVELKPIYLDFEFEDYLEMAFRNRPDLKAKEYMVEFNEYEKKISESKDRIKVDLTGSYGKSGGAYETETLNMDKDWFIGLKVSKPLGSNTLSTSYTKEETSEKHGQTSRTSSISKAVELGLLDGMQAFSERKSAEIGFKKAKEDLQKARELVIKEAKESYLNYKKGLVQVNTNLDKIKYREEELKITKARTELNEIPISELIKAYMSLSDEKLFYIESIGSLYQALAKLNKATGYALFLDNKGFMLANMK